jgi:hypothetical protein
LVVLRIGCNVCIDIVILRDSDSLLKTLSELRRAIFPNWHPRTQPQDILSMQQQGGATNGSSRDVEGGGNNGVELMNMDRVLAGLTPKQKQDLLVSVLPSKVSFVPKKNKASNAECLWRQYQHCPRTNPIRKQHLLPQSHCLSCNFLLWVTFSLHIYIYTYVLLFPHLYHMNMFKLCETQRRWQNKIWIIGNPCNNNSHQQQQHKQHQTIIILLRLIVYRHNTRILVWNEENPRRSVVVVVMTMVTTTTMMMVPTVRVMYGVLPVVIMA